MEKFGRKEAVPLSEDNHCGEWAKASLASELDFKKEKSPDGNGNSGIRNWGYYKNYGGFDR